MPAAAYPPDRQPRRPPHTAGPEAERCHSPRQQHQPPPRPPAACTHTTPNSGNAPQPALTVTAGPFSLALPHWPSPPLRTAQTEWEATEYRLPPAASAPETVRPDVRPPGGASAADFPPAANAFVVRDPVARPQVENGPPAPRQAMTSPQRETHPAGTPRRRPGGTALTTEHAHITALARQRQPQAAAPAPGRRTPPQTSEAPGHDRPGASSLFALRAPCRIRTDDLRFTRAVLWPAELRRRA